MITFKTPLLLSFFIKVQYLQIQQGLTNVFLKGMSVFFLGTSLVYLFLGEPAFLLIYTFLSICIFLVIPLTNTLLARSRGLFYIEYFFDTTEFGCETVQGKLVIKKSDIEQIRLYDQSTLEIKTKNRVEYFITARNQAVDIYHQLKKSSYSIYTE